MSRNQPSMLKIARLANVSAMTVSRVLNNSGPVAENTRKKVLAAAEEMKYEHVPNLMSRILRGERSRSIGILMSFARPSLNGEVIRRIGDELFPTDYVSYIVDTYSDPLVILRSLQTLAARRTDGVVYFGYSKRDISPEIIAGLKQTGHPVVVTHEKDFCQLPTVYCGWDPGVRHVVQYFSRRNCKCPVLLKESANASCSRLFEESCRKLGMKNWKIITCSPEKLAVHPEFINGLPGDGIFCSSEKFRIAVQDLLKEKKDFPLVVLMDDYLISQVLPTHPVLRRREPEAGAAAVKMLMDRIEGKNSADCHLDIAMEFIENITQLNSGGDENGII